MVFGEVDAGLFVGLAELFYGAVEEDGSDVGVEGGEDALRFSEGVGKDDGGAVLALVVAPPVVDLLMDG